MINAVSNDAMQRATTISGSPGNATAVAISTYRIDGGRGKHERQRRRADGAVAEESARDRDRAALATGQCGTADTCGQYRGGGTAEEASAPTDPG